MYTIIAMHTIKSPNTIINAPPPKPMTIAANSINVNKIVTKIVNNIINHTSFFHKRNCISRVKREAFVRLSFIKFNHLSFLPLSPSLIIIITPIIINAIPNIVIQISSL